LNRSILERTVLVVLVLILGVVVVAGVLEVTVYRGGRASGPPATPSASAPAPAADRVVLTPSGKAIAPKSAPYGVKRIVAAANEIRGLPYSVGFGHTPYPKRGLPPRPSAEDCSGAVSFVLAVAGYLRQPLDDQQLAAFGSAGPGHWVTVYVCIGGGAYMKIGGVVFDSLPAVMQPDSRLHWGNPAPTFPCAVRVVRHPPHL
jgi:hypothetical protein